MPLFDYICPTCHRRQEHLFLAGEQVVDSMPCNGCELDLAVRRTVNRFRIVGPVFSDLDRFNATLLTTEQRRNGMEFKSGKEIEQYEASQGLRRLDPMSTEARTLRAENMDEHNMYKDRAVAGGEDAAMDYMDKNDTQAITGWTDSQYVENKARTDAVTIPG
jgi:hypothetical protein